MMMMMIITTQFLLQLYNQKFSKTPSLSIPQKSHSMILTATHTHTHTHTYMMMMMMIYIYMLKTLFCLAT